MCDAPATAKLDTLDELEAILELTNGRKLSNGPIMNGIADGNATDGNNSGIDGAEPGVRKKSVGEESRTGNSPNRSRTNSKNTTETSSNDTSSESRSNSSGNISGTATAQTDNKTHNSESCPSDNNNNGNTPTNNNNETTNNSTASDEVTITEAQQTKTQHRRSNSYTNSLLSSSGTIPPEEKVKKSGSRMYRISFYHYMSFTYCYFCSFSKGTTKSALTHSFSLTTMNLPNVNNNNNNNNNLQTNVRISLPVSSAQSPLLAASAYQNPFSSFPSPSPARMLRQEMDSYVREATHRLNVVISLVTTYRCSFIQNWV